LPIGIRIEDFIAKARADHHLAHSSRTATSHGSAVAGQRQNKAQDQGRYRTCHFMNAYLYGTYFTTAPLAPDQVCETPHITQSIEIIDFQQCMVVLFFAQSFHDNAPSVMCRRGVTTLDLASDYAEAD
jgi:hypothetical protein